LPFDHASVINLEIAVYSPSPEYPAACRSAADLSAIGAAGMHGEATSAQLALP
jgi:hypothetical protein